MMTFSDLTSRLPIYVDPLMIAAVVPAVEAPKQGIAMAQWIPKTIGSQIIITGAERITVAGLPGAIAADVEKAKAAARVPFGILN